jgi:hypothetical protein
VANQVLAVSVLPGRLSVEPSLTTVTLHRDGGQLRGTLDGIVVTDARGTLQGWSVVATPVGAAPHPTHVDPRVDAVTGVTGEVTAAPVDRLDNGSRPLASARPGGGGGRFQISGDVWTPAHREREATVTLRISVNG